MEFHTISFDNFFTPDFLLFFFYSPFSASFSVLFFPFFFLSSFFPRIYLSAQIFSPFLIKPNPFDGEVRAEVQFYRSFFGSRSWIFIECFDDRRKGISQGLPVSRSQGRAKLLPHTILAQAKWACQKKLSTRFHDKIGRKEI